MKYIKTVSAHSYTPKCFEVCMTETDMETLDLLLTMYAPLISSRSLMVDKKALPLGKRLKNLRMGVNQTKRAIQEERSKI